MIKNYRKQAYEVYKIGHNRKLSERLFTVWCVQYSETGIDSIFFKVTVAENIGYGNIISHWRVIHENTSTKLYDFTFENAARNKPYHKNLTGVTQL